MEREQPSEQCSLVALLVVFALGGLFIAGLWAPPGVATPMLYAIVVLLAWWLPGPRSTLVVAEVSSLLIVLGLFLTASSGGPTSVAIINDLLALLTLWMTVALVLLQKQREEKVKHLTGLLPMCASCRKIRDDKGFWSQVEQYFEEHHADLQFTHGLCPPCSKQLYPDLFPRLSEQHPELYKEAQ